MLNGNNKMTAGNSPTEGDYLEPLLDHPVVRDYSEIELWFTVLAKQTITEKGLLGKLEIYNATHKEGSISFNTKRVADDDSVIVASYAVKMGDIEDVKSQIEWAVENAMKEWGDLDGMPAFAAKAED